MHVHNRHRWLLIWTLVKKLFLSFKSNQNIYKVANFNNYSQLCKHSDHAFLEPYGMYTGWNKYIFLRVSILDTSTLFDCIYSVLLISYLNVMNIFARIIKKIAYISISTFMKILHFCGKFLICALKQLPFPFYCTTKGFLHLDVYQF